MTRCYAGTGLLETLVVLGLVALALALAGPALAEMRASALTAASARRLATSLQALRWRSVAEGRSHGMLFRRDAQGWVWHVVRDGNGNGLRTAEIANGTDPQITGPQRLTPPARFGFPPRDRFPAVPPKRGTIEHTADPLRLGPADLVSFGPLGTSSSGTLFVTDGASRLFAVVLFGRTARVRVWRFAARGAGSWS